MASLGLDIKKDHMAGNDASHVALLFSTYYESGWFTTFSWDVLRFKCEERKSYPRYASKSFKVFSAPFR